MNKKIAVFAGSECIDSKKDFYHSLAYETGKALALAGFTVVTGAGPGLMDQALRGAREAGGHTIGFGLALGDRKHSEHAVDFEAFEKLGPRQEKMIAESDGYIALPGGVGTLYEVINIIEYKKIGEIPETKPLVLISDYYQPLSAIFSTMTKEGFVRGNINHLYSIVQNPNEAVSLLQTYYH